VDRFEHRLPKRVAFERLRQQHRRADARPCAKAHVEGLLALTGEIETVDEFPLRLAQQTVVADIMKTCALPRARAPEDGTGGRGDVGVEQVGARASAVMREKPIQLYIGLDQAPAPLAIPVRLILVNQHDRAAVWAEAGGA